MEVNRKEGFYRFYRSIRRFTEAYHFGSGLYLEAFLWITNNHAELVEMGIQVERTKQPLYKKQRELPAEERKRLEFALEYALGCSPDLSVCYRCFAEIPQTSVLSQMEFFMLAVPHKYRLEKELPFYFDDFILADYNYLLKKLSEIEAPIENCTTEICRSFAENDVQSVDFALSQD